MKKVIVFDMDDTLYDEYTFVQSGFRAVAKFLTSQLGEPADILFQEMWDLLQGEGRGAIFDDTLKKYGYYTKEFARKCVSVYRLHDPEISLSNEAEGALNLLAQFPLYLVTDGNKIVQHKKVQALGLDKIMKHCFITHRYGIKHAKPSPYCFLQIQKRENVPTEKIVYIGDNPHKDFVGIKPLGFRTIRVKTGEYRDSVLTDQYEAEVQIESLEEVTDALKKIWTDWNEV